MLRRLGVVPSALGSHGRVYSRECVRGSLWEQRGDGFVEQEEGRRPFRRLLELTWRQMMPAWTRMATPQ